MMTNDSFNQESQQVTITKLLNDEQVLVHINPHAPGVELPTQLMQNRSVTLRLSRYFRGELTTDDEKVSAQLLFGADYFTCIIPWTSVWGASSAYGEEYVWNDAAPAQVIEVVMAERNLGARTTPKKRPEKPNVGSKTNHLRRVK